MVFSFKRFGWWASGEELALGAQPGLDCVSHHVLILGPVHFPSI